MKKKRYIWVFTFLKGPVKVFFGLLIVVSANAQGLYIDSLGGQSYLEPDSINEIKPSKPLRRFYYQWSYRNEKGEGWGENMIYLNHYPTRLDISKQMKQVIQRPLYKYDQLYIREIMPDEPEPFRNMKLDRGYGVGGNRAMNRGNHILYLHP